ncbi:MAG TPA: hypothetical protein VMA98_07100 [Candidatus Acidoferrales bacterium]|nr:hypothetical protein [Candidatus Acidoferrales bacterium]
MRTLAGVVLAAMLLGAEPAPQTLIVDLDADHRPDTVVLTQEPAQITVTVTYGNPRWTPERFIFTVDPAREDGVCALPVSLRRETLGYDLTQAVGHKVDGFVRSSHLYGFSVIDNRCDSLHFFFNHATKKMEWWRL